jgi:predicted ATPase
MSTWLKFIRQYGPVARNDNMYDETIQRSARRAKVSPLEFPHPHHDVFLKTVKEDTFTSVILTGTAGDGKTHLCRQAWQELGGSPDEWEHDSPYLILQIGTRKVHFIRDLSAWAPQQGHDWPSEKLTLLKKMCDGFFEAIGNESFVIAANDGQLVETWRRLPSTDKVDKARHAIARR